MSSITKMSTGALIVSSRSPTCSRTAVEKVGITTVRLYRSVLWLKMQFDIETSRQCGTVNDTAFERHAEHYC